MSFEITGRLAEIFETQQISDRFQKREFILEIKESSANGFEFVDFIKFQVTQDKCALLDQVQPDDMVKVSFNLRGRKWEKEGRVSYFTNLDAWRVEKLSAEGSPESSSTEASQPEDDVPFPSQPPESDQDYDDLPF
jgi:hypothetical protein